MGAFWTGTGREFRACGAAQVVERLTHEQVRHYPANTGEMFAAWRDSVPVLQASVQDAWFVLLEFPMLRLGRRIDAVVLTDRAIFVLEFKREQADLAALRQVEDYALDLQDFHAGSRGWPIIPVLVSAGAAETAQGALPIAGVARPVACRPAALGEALRAAMRDLPARALDAQAWIDSPYRPVPTIIDAAVMIYGRNAVAEIAAARADQKNLHETSAAIGACLAAHRRAGRKVALFVTGIPGAGKTLCGLNAAFGDAAGAGTFLTGNPSLVHVLREALARDAIARGGEARAVRQRMEGVIQALPRFRTHYLTQAAEIPAEAVTVIDEAQRCWSRDYAMRKTRDKPVPLSDSEPGHLLDILGRHAGFAGMVCLVGSGQEIHDGEGGLAEWGAALRARPDWAAVAAPDAAGGGEARWRLGAVPGLRVESALHLDVPVRQVRGTGAAAWVDAVLRNAPAAARAIADAAPLPFLLTRDVPALRAGLRARARGQRRAGLLASSGGRRLRAEGLGAELPHMDAAAVAHWFLDRFPPDVRASDALEQVATEFSCQGLELDYAGLCWDADLARAGGAWAPRRFAGSAWQTMRTSEQIANQLNTYRVLLTRGRYETIIYVPRGAAADPTRPPGVYDAIADFLAACGAACLEDAPAPCPASAAPDLFAVPA